MSSYVAVVKRAFAPLVADDEECVPGNIGALKKGLQALLAEDANDDVRASQKWADAKALLAEEAENETGAGAEGHVQVDDTFFMGNMSGSYEGYSYTYGYGG